MISSPRNEGFISISRWSGQEFGLCFRPEQNKILKCHFSPPANPMPRASRVVSLWAISNTLNIPCGVSQKTDQDWELISLLQVGEEIMSYVKSKYLPVLASSSRQSCFYLQKSHLETYLS